jgi:hypothetical protein
MAAAVAVVGGPVPRKNERTATRSEGHCHGALVPNRAPVPAIPCAPNARPGPFPPKENGADVVPPKENGADVGAFRAPSMQGSWQVSPQLDSRQRLILFLAVDVSDISVLLIAILDEDRTVEVLIGEFVIIFPLG